MPKYWRKKERFEIVKKEVIDTYISQSLDEEFNVLFAWAWLSGMRIRQLLNLHKRDITIDEKELTVSYGGLKGGKNVTHIYHLDDPFVGVLMIPYIKNREGGMFSLSKRSYQDRLFKLNNRIYPGQQELWITFHYLRHSRITQWIRVLCFNPADMKDFSGHKSDAYEEYFQVQMAKKAAGRYGEGM